MQDTGKLQNVALPVSQCCWPVTTSLASGNQQSTFGEDSAVTGVRCCQNWAAALTTVRLTEQLAVPIVDWRGARSVTAEGTGRSIRIENGKKIIISDEDLSFVFLWNY
jgi:hypothetical protein